VQAEPLTAILRRKLEKLSYAQLVETLGPPDRQLTEYAEGAGYWHVGDGEPMVDASADPAIAQAVGRCAASRVRMGGVVASVVGAVHRPCEWEDYPLLELLRACDHATWKSRFVVTELAAWEFGNGLFHSASTGRAGEYDNPVWARFFMGATPATAVIPPSERRWYHDHRAQAIEEAAQGPAPDPVREEVRA
jgi:hypothetical protein